MNPGERLRARRRELGVSVAELARSAGLKPSTLYDLERGDSRTSRQLYKLCHALGLNISWVETGSGERLARGNPRENGLEIIIGGERITPETARLAAQIERLDEIVRDHVKGMVEKLAQAEKNEKK